MLETTQVTQLLNMTKSSEIEAWIVTNTELIAWKAVGDKQNNVGIINMGTDPAAAVIERLTNGIDAIIERSWIENGKPDIKSPRKATEELFGVPKGYLSGMGNSSDYQKHPSYVHAKKLVVSFDDSDDNNLPTVSIEDRGQGISADNFAKTILNLNGSNKMSKHFLAGAYGQGGSTAVSFSKYTLIFSKSKSNLDDKEYLACTIIRYNPLDPTIYKNGRYEYCVFKETGSIIKVENTDFEQGTLIRHVETKLRKYKGNITNPQGSLYYLVNHYLFNPVLPFTIRENRTNKTSTSRVITGNNRLLSFNKNLQYSNSQTLTFGDGYIRFNWWVVYGEKDASKSSSSKPDGVTSYVQHSKPIILTLNGQKQGAITNTLIKKDLKLPYIDKHLVVEVECDQLASKEKRDLFSSSRENLRSGSVDEELRALLLEILQSDQKLIELNQNFKMKLLGSTHNDVKKDVQTRLAKKISEFLQTRILVGGSGTKKPGGGSGGSPMQPITLVDPPTLLEITTKPNKQVSEESSFHLKFKTNAYASKARCTLVCDKKDAIEERGAYNLKNGYGTFFLKVAPNITAGTTLDLEVQLEYFDEHDLEQVLKDDISIEIVPPKEGDGGKGKKSSVSVPNIEIIQVDHLHNYWQQAGWTPASVSAVAEDSSSIDIYVNIENKHLNHLITKAQSKGTDQVEAIKNFYIEQIAYHSFVAKHQLDKDDALSEKTDAIFASELSRFSESLTSIMRQIFNDIIA